MVFHHQWAFELSGEMMPTAKLCVSLGWPRVKKLLQREIKVIMSKFRGLRSKETERLMLSWRRLPQIVGGLQANSHRKWIGRDLS